jgi:thiol-disulfide isomerase/thioredoxin
MWIQAAIFVLLLVIAYRFWKTQPKREVKNNTARLYFFYTTWCGYSKKAMPEWEKVKADLNTSPVFGKTTIEPVDIDADKDRKTASLYEVAGYPTIKLETSSGVYDFDRSVTHDNIMNFLRETLGKEPHRL